MLSIADTTAQTELKVQGCCRPTSPYFLFLLSAFFAISIFYVCPASGNTIDSYSKQHSPSEALFQPSPGKISGLLEF